jgi:hypothetical protein
MTLWGRQSTVLLLWMPTLRTLARTTALPIGLARAAFLHWQRILSVEMRPELEILQAKALVLAKYQVLSFSAVIGRPC